MEQISIQTPGASITVPVKKLTGPIKIIGLVVILVVVVSAVLLGTRIWDPVWNPFRPSPEKVMAMMFENMKDVKTSHAAGKMILSVDQVNDISGKVTILMDSDSDISNIASPKLSGSFQASYIDQATSMLVKAKTKIIDNAVYFNIEEFNVPSLTLIFGMMGIDIDTMKGVWIKSSDLQAAPDQFSAKMQELISNTKVYDIKEQLPDQKIDGQSMYHYSMVLNNERFIDLMDGIMDETVEMSQNALMAGMVKGMILEALKNIGEIKAELFIGKKDYLIYGLKMLKDINVSAISPGMSGVMGINFEQYYSKYNQPVVIQAPANFENLEEFILNGSKL